MPSVLTCGCRRPCSMAFSGHLRGTPIEGDARQMDRLMELDLMDRLRAVSIIAGGEIDNL